MDIMLERILSLIPRKESGAFQHGALKDFAHSIGLKSGNSVTDWMSGRSESYKNYVYEVSSKYGVSVEWLRGETDKKEPAENPDRLNPDYMKLNAANRAAIDAAIAALLEAQRSDG